MTQHSSTVAWTQGMAFEVELDGHRFLVDANPEFGGQDQGPRPKGLLLSALGGCSGMDVVSILNKMRVELDGFEMRVSGELTEDHPKVYRSIHIQYVFKGKDLPMDKLDKAVKLSQEKYCGVSAMLAKVAQVTHEIVVE